MEPPTVDETDDSILDPRIQIELEKLNTATDEINTLEVELDEASKTFEILLNESTRRLKILRKKLGSCIERARPYYNALDKAKQRQQECQKAAVQFQRANEIHQAAKETVALAEQRFLSKQHEWQFDSAWQEMLNHATIKVMEAENQKSESGLEHQKRALLFNEAEQEVQLLESRFRRNINKARPYFDEKVLCQQQLRTQKDRIDFLQKKVTKVKQSYAQSLKELERISEEIHSRRGDDITARGVREPGVGAESTSFLEENYASQRKNSLPSFDLESELEKCELQSLGSCSVATSSAVSEDECGEEESDLEEVKNPGCDTSDESQSCVTGGKMPIETYDNVRRLSESWERQMSETINKLGVMLSLKHKDTAPVCPENVEKY